MALFLSDIHLRLSAAERLRIQKLLGLILPKEDQAAACRLIQNGYARLGAPTKWLRKHGLFTVFQKLLDAFCILPANALGPDEKEQLLKNPYTLWPDKNCCSLNVDAWEFLANDRDLRKTNYLWLRLRKLSSREKKAWGQWLGLDFAIPSEKARGLLLYRYLAHLHCQQQGIGDSFEQKTYLPSVPNFLDEAFPNDPLVCPMAWFYRGVLSFYGALQETEQKSKQLPTRSAALLPLFKSGRLMVSAAAPELGQALRWQIITTRETSFAPVSLDRFASFLPTPTGHTEMLF